jgi:hypothetical protein
MPVDHLLSSTHQHREFFSDRIRHTGFSILESARQVGMRQ